MTSTEWAAVNKSRHNGRGRGQGAWTAEVGVLRA